MLLEAARLRDLLGPEDLIQLATTCLRHVVRRMSIQTPFWRFEMRNIKNCAYAWRQMVFYVALVPSPDQQVFAASARRILVESREGVAIRLEPAVVGLEQAAAGNSPQVGGGRRVLGWSSGQRHWLARPREAFTA